MTRGLHHPEIPETGKNGTSGNGDVIRCAPGYASLADVLNRAFDQAARGKGDERHATPKPFEQQPMQARIRAHGIGFATGQAGDKAETLRLVEANPDLWEAMGRTDLQRGLMQLTRAVAQPTFF